MKNFERVSAFSQNAGLFEATQISKAEEYLKSFDKIDKANAVYLENLLLLPEEQAFNALSELREKICNAPTKVWLTYADISEYFSVILSLALEYMKGVDFLNFGENVTLINKAFNTSIRETKISLRLKKEYDIKSGARKLRKVFKENYTEDLFEVICLVSLIF